MTTPNIIMTRIDERLIHGQGQLWVKYLGCNTVIVANDEVSTDKMQQTLMKTVVPDSVAMRFFPLQKVIDIIHKANPGSNNFYRCEGCKRCFNLGRRWCPYQRNQYREHSQCPW